MRAFFQAMRVSLGLIGDLFSNVLVVLSLLVAFLATANFLPLVLDLAQNAVHRTVKIQAMHIGWRNGLLIDLRGLELPSPAWGTEPDMIRLEHLIAVIDVPALRRGVMQYNRLDIDGLSILLERDKQGLGNWKFDGVSPAREESPRHGGLAAIPASRLQFPTIIAAHLRDGLLRIRTSSGHVLRLDGRDLVIRSTGDNGPIQMALDGAYNAVDAKLTVNGASAAAMRDGTVPYALQAGIATADDRLDFAGTIMEPLDFDGVRGKITIAVPVAADIMPLAGVDRKVTLSAALNGVLTKRGDHWQLDQVVGRLLRNSFSGAVVLDEGGRGQPDALDLALSMPRFDVDPVLKGIGAGRATKPKDWRAIVLQADANPGTLLKARIKAGLLTVRRALLRDVALQFSILPSRVSLAGLSFKAVGGDMALQADLTGQSRKAKLTATLTMRDVKPVDILRLTGMGNGPLAGHATLQARIAMTGGTLGLAVAHSDILALATITDGQIDRRVVELVSADLRLLFHHSEDVVPLSCLMAGVVVRDGIGHIAPVLLQTDMARVNGVGNIDLRQETLDLLMKSDRRMSGFFALDVPFRVSGKLAHPVVTPAFGEDAAEITRAANVAIPSELRTLNGVDCLTPSGAP